MSTSTQARSINAAGLSLIKEFEGLRLSAYRDSVGVWTIGYGHTAGVRAGQAISAAQAEEFLRQDLRQAEQAVSASSKVPLNDNQFAALVSFTFNLGAGALAESTLLKKLNASDFAGAAAEFGRWVYAGGERLPGLERRRQAERELFLRPVTPAARPTWLLVCPSEDWQNATDIDPLHIPTLELVAKRLGLPFRSDALNKKVYLGKGGASLNTDKPQLLPLAQRIRPQQQSNSKSCGQASVAMAINVLTGQDLRDLDIAARYGYSLMAALQAECPKHTWRDAGNFTRSMWSDIAVSLQDGCPVIIGLNGPDFSPSGYGHIVVIVATTGSTVTLADPATGKLRTVAPRQIEDCPPHTDGKFVFLCRPK